MANESNPGLFGGFQLPGLQMPAFSQTSMADNPVMNTLTGSMDFMKNLWGGSSSSLGSIAGFVAPTLDVEQLDRKITDLKAVEGWLHANASILRATIQALEVQRNTIVTLQSFSNLAAQQGPGASAAPEAAPSSVSPNWPMPPSSTSPSAPTRMREPEPDLDDMLDPEDDYDPEDDAPPDMPAEEAPPVEAAPAPAAKRATGKTKAAAGAAPSAEALAQSAALAGQATNASIQNATAWWNLLQDQFAKVAHAAVAKSDSNPAPGAGGKTAKKPTTTKPPLKKATAKKTAAKSAAAKTGKKAVVGKLLPKQAAAKTAGPGGRPASGSASVSAHAPSKTGKQPTTARPAGNPPVRKSGARS